MTSKLENKAFSAISTQYTCLEHPRNIKTAFWTCKQGMYMYVAVSMVTDTQIYTHTERLP